MSGAAEGHGEARTALARFAQGAALLVLLGLLLVASRASLSFHGTFGVIAALGLLLLTGVLASGLLEAIGLPHLTGYLLAGIAVGPHGLHFIDHETVVGLQHINTLALALIALAGGAELRIELLRSSLHSVGIASVVQVVIGIAVATGSFLAISPLLPFMQPMKGLPVLAVAVIWSVVSIGRSPSATLGILAQLRPDGPITRFALAFVMSSDVIVVVLLTLVLSLVRPWIEPSASISLEELHSLGRELLGSFSLGTSLGLLLGAYLRIVRSQLLIPLVALGFGLTEGLHYLRFEPLLTFLVAGFVVQNLTKQGPKLLHAVEETGSVVYVIFFATAGAHLDLPLLRELWPVALFLTGTRGLSIWAAHRLSARIARDEPVLQRWGFAPLISQAGLTIGMSVVVARAYPSFGGELRSLIIAAVAINELVGPILFKLALDRTEETGRAPA